jgi:hypothetical protein
MTTDHLEAASPLAYVGFENEWKSEVTLRDQVFDGLNPVLARGQKIGWCRKSRAGFLKSVEDQKFRFADQSAGVEAGIRASRERRASISRGEQGVMRCHRNVEKPRRPEFPLQKFVRRT